MVRRPVGESFSANRNIVQHVQLRANVDTVKVEELDLRSRSDECYTSNTSEALITTGEGPYKQ
ncbi:hypothetical protein F443_12476 [Phytophthora nicotianae P1569]|uniref:Uncharacterized protein n=1 Tax=Phytophthora nicotianae P1569 TaxID=1317065 RepID=V9EU80_PHYNI|nr:hypothetical protein F443_12476 [Phytophthora nicotianae P1569]